MNAEQIAYYETMERCNKAFLNALSAGHGSDKLMWSAQPQGKTCGDRYTLSAVIAKNEFVDSLKTHSAPCWRCGARGGCGHR